MARICTRKNGSRFIQFTRLDGSGRVATIGRDHASKKAAEGFLVRIEQLLEAKGLGGSLAPDLAAWVADRPDDVYVKLVQAGLVEPRKKIEAVALKPFLDAYMARRTDAKPATRVGWALINNDLCTFLGNDRELTSISTADGMDFKAYLQIRLQPTTVTKRLQFARQVFNDARKRKLISENPFQDVRGSASISLADRKFVDRETITSILEHADPTWRTIVALARFGGLRC